MLNEPLDKEPQTNLRRYPVDLHRVDIKEDELLDIQHSDEFEEMLGALDVLRWLFIAVLLVLLLSIFQL